MPDPMEEIIAHGFDLAKKGKKEEAYKVLKAVSDNLPEDHPANREALGVIRTRLAALCNDTDRESESVNYAEWVLKNAPPEDEMIRMMLQMKLHTAGRGPMPRFESEKKGGCFIATASYGSPFAAEVKVFRQFRDEKLLPSKLGAAVVRLYYFVSPPVAKVISKREFLRAITRRVFLEPILRLIKK
jgi:hypothetical protein